VSLSQQDFTYLKVMGTSTLNHKTLPRGEQQFGLMMNEGFGLTLQVLGSAVPKFRVAGESLWLHVF
jgi:hypothetical protein